MLVDKRMHWIEMNLQRFQAHVMPTFKTETLRLVSNVKLVKHTVKRKANTALSCSFSIVTHNMLRY